MMLISLISFSQVSKHYKGNYESGQAEYDYYENENFERIYHGDFFSIETIDYGIVQKVYSSKGKYNHNKKDGKWIFVKAEGHESKQFGHLYSKTEIIGLFENGLRTGKWLIVQSEKNNGIEKVDTFYVNFINDKLADHFFLPFLDGSFNSKGEPSGRWTFHGSKETIIDFINGRIQFLLVRNTETGNIITKYTCPIESNENQNEYVLNDSVFVLKKSSDKFTVDSDISSRFNYIIESFTDRGVNKYSLPETFIIEFDQYKTDKIKNDKIRSIESEKMKELELKNKFKFSTLGSIYSEIKREFEEWMKKTEFESEDDFKNRIQNESEKKLNEISSKVISRSKENAMQGAFGKIVNYNPEKMELTIALNTLYSSLETEFHVPLNKIMAEEFVKMFGGNEIYFVPQLVTMENNEWVILSGVFFFDVGLRNNSRKYFSLYDKYVREHTWTNDKSILNLADEISKSDEKSNTVYITEFDIKKYYFVVETIIEPSIPIISIKDLGIELPLFK